MFTLLLILALLQVKHWLVDFVFQTNEMIQWKGVYGDRRGLAHSIQHGVWSALVLVGFVVGGVISIPMMITAILLEVAVHYHIDFLKQNWGEQDPMKKPYWMHLGFDQMAHQIWYLLMVALLLGGS